MLFLDSAVQLPIKSSLSCISGLSPAIFGSKYVFMNPLTHNDKHQHASLSNQAEEIGIHMPVLPVIKKFYISIKQTRASNSSPKNTRFRNAHLPLHPRPPNRRVPIHLPRNREPNQRFHISHATVITLLAHALETTTRGKAGTDKWID